MRPDRIIIGECRGGEAMDMLQAMNTGHEGSMTTVHANNTRDAMARLEVMIAMAGYDIPTRALRTQIANAIQIVIQARRVTGGRRKVTAVSEIVGMEGDNIQMHDLFAYEQSGVDENGHAIGSVHQHRDSPRRWPSGSKAEAPDYRAICLLGEFWSFDGRRSWKLLVVS